MRRTVAIAAVLVVGPLVAALPAAGKSSPRLGFAKPVYVDTSISGGEPFVIYSKDGHDLIYSAHEGTTLLLRDGVFRAPVGTADFVTNYRNQVNIWTSGDDGRTWKRVNFHGTGFFSSPASNLGFSDPDLTEDEGGTIYDTGIDLANDTLYSSSNGGKTWPTGTIQCHEGDRPWLAGGHAHEVFLSTDSSDPTLGHIVVRSTDDGKTCSSTAIPDNGGFGKLYYDHHDGSLVDPVPTSDGVSIGILQHASQAFDNGSGAFVQHTVAKTTLLGHFPSIGIDGANNLYMVWDTNPRKTGTSGCSGHDSPAANSIEMASSTDHGVTWSQPVTIAHPGTTVLWPWVQAGNAGALGVVWYQYDRVTDPDCGTGSVTVHAATVFNATSSSRTISSVNAGGRTIHVGGICQGGTTCVATGQDRRLGDFFTNAVDNDGCIMIATGDTMMTDPITHAQLPTSRPLFLKQDKGMGLYGKPCVAAAAETSSTPVAAPRSSNGGGSLATTGLPLAASAFAAFLVAAGLVVRRRMHRTG
jgi:hypothetical protein